MERNPSQHVAVINTVPATEENQVVHNNTSKQFGIVKEGYDTAGVEGAVVPVIGKPIDYGKATLVETLNSVAEVAQVVSLRGTETIVVGRQYKIIIRAGKEVNDFQGPKVETFSTLAVTGDTQATVMARLRAKVEAYAGSRVEVLDVVEIAFTAGEDVGGDLTAGQTFTQATSGATGYILSVNITSGTIAGADAAGTVQLVVLSGTFSASSLVTTFADTSKLTTASVGTVQTDEFCLVDKGDYFLTSNYSVNGGVSEVQLIGFTGVAATIIQAGVYSVGNGTHMLALVPSWNRQKNNPQSGDAFFDVETLPIAGQRYTKMDLHFNEPISTGHLLPDNSSRPGIITVWIKEDDTAGTVTKVTAMIAEVATCAALAAGGSR